MDSGAVYEEPSVSVDHVDSGDQTEGFGRTEFSDRVSWNGESNGGLASSFEVLTQLELDLACSSEKILNLFVLMMDVATRESDFEAFASEGERAPDDLLRNALEFDFLSGVLDSEVRELDGFMEVLRPEISNARELVYSCSHDEGAFQEMDDKLRDSEESYKQSLDQISEIRTQSETFQRELSIVHREENRNSDKRVEEDPIFCTNTNIKMKTAEQQRHILRMLEKSLAREIDLEKKLGELRQVEEELKQRLIASEGNVYCLEDETADVSGRWFEVENNAVVLKGISKELLGRLQILQFNVNGHVAREIRLRSILDDITDNLKDKESSLNHSESSGAEVNDVPFISDLMGKTNTESNTEHNEEPSVLEIGLGASEKVASLERQLRESNIQLQHAIALAEASQEKQSLLCCTVDDMQQLIDDLKMKAAKHERLSDTAEDKCIVLSESNAALNEELSFLRGRLESLEGSLQRADESKIGVAKGIGLQTKVVKNLVKQLACERNRLHKQITSLATENTRLVQKLQEKNKDHSVVTKLVNTGNGEEFLKPEQYKDEVTETHVASPKLVKTRENVPLGEDEVPATPEPETQRRIDAGVLSFKHVSLAFLIVLISVGAYFSFQLESCPF